MQRRVPKWKRVSMSTKENVVKMFGGIPASSVIPMGDPSQWRHLLKLGNNGADVAAWQTVLMAGGADISDQAGMFGQSTHNSTLSFQHQHKLPIDGQVGTMTRAAIGHALPGPEPVDPVIPVHLQIPFVEAKNWSRNLPPRSRVDWVVLHCMEGEETSTRAEKCAARFADPMNAPKASAHYCIDCDSIVQCVNEDRIAWHAPGANAYGIGIEHAGFARQTREQWLDPFGIAMFGLSAKLTAEICGRWNIPKKYVASADLIAGVRGITTHAEVSKAFKKSDHTDPGRNFPMDWYIERVNSARA
jgi:hypothetical protein